MKNTIFNVSSSELFERQTTRQEEKKIDILVASINLFAKHGYDDVSFEDIAKKCKISRTLVNHYFKTKDELLLLVCNFVRINYQKLVLSKMTEARSAEALLSAYVSGAVHWVFEAPEHAKIWFFYFYRCTNNPHFSQLNTDFVDVGFARIQQILVQFCQEKNLPAEHIPEKARILQITITGTIVSLITETRSEKERLQLARNCLERCLRIAAEKY